MVICAGAPGCALPRMGSKRCHDVVSMVDLSYGRSSGICIRIHFSWVTIGLSDGSLKSLTETPEL